MYVIFQTQHSAISYSLSFQFVGLCANHNLVQIETIKPRMIHALVCEYNKSLALNIITVSIFHNSSFSSFKVTTFLILGS